MEDAGIIEFLPAARNEDPSTQFICPGVEKGEGAGSIELSCVVGDLFSESHLRTASGWAPGVVTGEHLLSCQHNN